MELQRLSKMTCLEALTSVTRYPWEEVGNNQVATLLTCEEKKEINDAKQYIDHSLFKAGLKDLNTSLYSRSQGYSVAVLTADFDSTIKKASEAFNRQIPQVPVTAELVKKVADELNNIAFRDKHGLSSPYSRDEASRFVSLGLFVDEGIYSIKRKSEGKEAGDGKTSFEIQVTTKPAITLGMQPQVFTFSETQFLELASHLGLT